MSTQYSNIKILVRGAYDIQALRIQMGNRIAANFRSKLGLKPSQPEAEVDNEGKEILKELRASYNKITDGIAKITLTTFTGDAVISTYTEFALVAEYFELLHTEEKHFERFGKVLKEIPIYKQFLKNVKGIGPAIAGVIISEIDITKARHPSSIWAYAGVDVAPDGKGRSRKKAHLVKVKYKNKKGEELEKDSITFNPFLKTKLLGVLGGSFLKCKSPYADIYYNYQERLENHFIYKDTTKLHRYRMSIRYMIKMFLLDLYVAWRTLEGLPVSLPYAQAKLGYPPHGGHVETTNVQNGENQIVEVCQKQLETLD